MNSPQPYQSVEAALARLPVEIAPPHDLWPAIARSTGSAGSAVARPWPVALAASLALCTLVGALSWSVWQRPAGQLARAPSMGIATAASPPVSIELPQDAGYQATRSALEQIFAERLQLLAPATRLRVQQDLDVIHQANADIRAALEGDPASPLLLHLLRSTWQQEFNLYTTVTHATDTLLTRRS